jgi:hypothetical protein
MNASGVKVVCKARCNKAISNCQLLLHEVFKRGCVSVACLAAAVCITSTVCAETYQQSGKSYEMTWPKGDWDGLMGFPGVYCAKAPASGQAKMLTQTMFSGGAVYVGKIAYPNNILMAVVFSSIPAGRTAEEDVAKLLASNKDSQKRAQAAKLTYEVDERPSKLGTMIAIRINNIESDTRETGPFPLVKAILSPKDGGPLTMSVHRLFARGSDRFEVAAMRVIPLESRNEAGERETLEQLNSLVDSLTDSLQSCTQGLPPRTKQ